MNLLLQKRIESMVKQKKTIDYLGKKVISMRVTPPPPFWYAVFRGCFGGTQYAKGRYAVRKILSYRTQTSIFTFKRSNFHQETQET